MGKTKLKTYYIEVDEKIIQVQATRKTASMTLFADIGYIVTYRDVKLSPPPSPKKISLSSFIYNLFKRNSGRGR